MSTFWMIGAAMLAGALLLLLVPLLRAKHQAATTSVAGLNRDVYRQRLRELDADRANGVLAESQHERARLDLYAELLHDADTVAVAQAGRLNAVQRRGAWALALVVVLLMPVGVYWLYGQVGAGKALPRLQDAVALRASGLDQPNQSVDDMVAGLEARMRAEPDNLEGQGLLARSYLIMGRHADAAKAYERLLQMSDDHEAATYTNAAQAIAMAAGRDFTGRPAVLLDKALAKEPDNLVASFLLGFGEMQEGQTEAALQRWRKLYASIDPNSDDAKQVARSIAIAEEKLGIAATTEASMADSDAAAGEQIEVVVEIDPQLADSLAPDQVVYVFARAVSGPPMPLAAQRLRVADLPSRILLDDRAAVMPRLKLSGAEQVQIGARVSMSGNATPADGDLESAIVGAVPGQEGLVTLRIDRTRGAELPVAIEAAPAQLSAAPEQIRVAVAVDEGLAAELSPDMTVFVFARALSGPPMPLAARRLRVGDLPTQLVLDDQASVMPQMKLSGAPQVRLAARISQSSTAMPTAGDLESAAVTATPGQKATVTLHIDRRR